MALEYLTGKEYSIYDIEEDYMDYVINEKNWPKPDNTTLSRLSDLLFERGYLKDSEYEVEVSNFGDTKPAFEQMKESIDDGMPILISFRGEHGHAYIVVGYAGDNGKGTEGLIVYDPNSGEKSNVPMEIIDNQTFQDKDYGIGFIMFKRK